MRIPPSLKTGLKMGACIGLAFLAVLLLLYGMGVTHLSLMAQEMLVFLIATSVVAGRFLLVR